MSCFIIINNTPVHFKIEKQKSSFPVWNYILFNLIIQLSEFNKFISTESIKYGFKMQYQMI
jgi:hypothetical protein